LGRGGFCVVNEVAKITLLGSESGEASQQNGGGGGGIMYTTDEHHIHNIVQDRGFMAKHTIRRGKDFRYAIKRVQDKSKDDPQLYVNAVVDLATEARFLSVIRHSNIIKMRAMDDASPFTSGFFVLLDKLYDIMPARLKKWKKQEGGGLKKLLKSKAAKTTFWLERLAVAYDLACALSYLHGMRYVWLFLYSSDNDKDDHIHDSSDPFFLTHLFLNLISFHFIYSVIYRDLKPDNIGFDVRGDVKIFDFGLAKELDPRKKLGDGTYNLTGDTGSPRYMAPEVFLEKTYNETADTYSFAILCWQILAIETPFDHIKTNSMFEKAVIIGGVRPKIKEEWGPSIGTMLRESFVGNPKRPSMADTCERLRIEINRLSDEDIDEYLDESRRSRLSNC
jgi:serine/threonine protein kinase